MNIKKTSIMSLMMAIVVALVPLIEFWHSKTVYSGADLQFHINRIHELANQIQSGHISLISYDSFNSVGSGVQYFYPSLTLVPAALIFIVLKNGVTAYYVSLVLYGLIAYAVSQYAFGAIIKDKWLTTLASVMLSLSAYHVFSIVGVSAFGEFIAMAWIPLVFLGYHRVINHQGWRTLWLSLVLMAYTHLLSLVLTVVILAVLTFVRLVFSHQAVLSELITYIKIIIAFTLSFLAFLVPFVILMKQNDIVSPDATLHYQWAKSFAGYYVSSVRPLSTRTLGCIYVVTLVGMFIAWKRLASQTRLYFWIGLSLLFVASSDFPWFMIQHTAVATLQFPYRIVPFALYFLTLASVLAIRDFSKSSQSVYLRKILVILFGLITVGTTLLSVHEYKKAVTSTYRLETTVQGHLNYTPFAAYRVNNETFDKQFNNYFNTYGAFDYWTTTSLTKKWSIVGHKVWNSKGQAIHSATIKNKSSLTYVVHNTKTQQLDLPFLKYQGIGYSVTVDGVPVKIATSQRGTIAVNVKKGHHRITVQAKMTNLMLLVIGISILSTVTVVVFPYWKKH